MIFGFWDIIPKVFPQALVEFSPAYVWGTENFRWVMPLSNFDPLGAKKNMIFTGVGWNIVTLHWGFDPISKVQIHYANTEVHTQEICLDPLRLMNFYTNEYLSKHCYEDQYVIFGAVVQKINFVVIHYNLCITKYISCTSCEEDTKHFKSATKVN